MEDIKLTKDAASLLKRLHAAYKKRVKDGQTKQMAVIFGGPSDIQQEIRSKWSLADTEYACGQLCTAGLLDSLPGDDETAMIWLTAKGIAYAEGEIAGVLKAAWDLIKELLHFAP